MGIKVGVFIIDPQNDFCHRDGALSVGGADEDMERLAAMIYRLGRKIKQIYVTMDTHHLFHIAHPSFWIDHDLKNPAPYQEITVEDVKTGIWRSSIPELSNWALEYVEGLAKKGNYNLTIWNPHCLIGSWGGNIYEPLYKSLLDWEAKPGNMVTYQTKGSNYKTEHYSVFQAEYPDPGDATTQFNNRFAEAINSCDKVIIAGEARTHCVLNSLKDIIEATKDEFIKKMIFVEDASSNVQIPAAIAKADSFFAELVAKGMEVTTTDKFLA